ncbi:lipopolysaccharide biosynthesis protein [Thermogemmatispora carboxidivorans]|uniref:lipopolysaccharide biosynthesis protein n=1 Tax=Thermogemmatispora carboxidivorans TaxID=1382306 RepID=UPI00069AABDE|nr:polysaccharide biosynthesis C-terminal domain-containing protein [Thermogemmatispora carboxidivorans]
MQRPRFHPLRLKRLYTGQLASEAAQSDHGMANQADQPTPQTTLPEEASGQDGTQREKSTPNRPHLTEVVGTSVISTSASSSNGPATRVESSGAEAEARHLLRRTPISYLLNQAYGLWFFLSSFILTLIITRAFVNSHELYGVYAVAMSAFNTIAYIVAFGLEDATTTYVPRVLAEHGQPAAASLIRRLLLLRSLTLVLCMGVMLFALPALAWPFGLLPSSWTWASDLASGLRNPQLLRHITPIAFYVLGNGIISLQTAVCASFMRMRLVFVIGSLAQLVQLPLSYLVLRLDSSVDGLLWMQALVSLASAAAFLIWQAPLLLQGGARYRQPLKPVIRLGLSAWLTNLVSGALLKQTVIILLGSFAVPLAEIGYFNLSYQLGHTASLLMVTGFGGVAGSALAAAFVGQNYARLARSWQALIKIETLLAAPVLVFSFFNASVIAHLLYQGYEPVGPLLALFLTFQILIRTLGTSIHQSTLYVVGKAWQVVLGQWIGLLSLIILGIALIPGWGPAGALIADGLAQVIGGALLLGFLWRLLPERYPLGYTLRLLLALALAAAPSLLLHPYNFPTLILAGLIYLAGAVLLLLLIRPLTQEDLGLLHSLHPRLARYLRPFARAQRTDRER